MTAFLCTIHDKSPYDGIGGTVKRLIVKESLQRCFIDQINSVQKVLNFCSLHIKNIRYRLLLKQNIQKKRNIIEDCFSKAKTIPGTQGFH